ncbi:GDSL-like lipase/acylhydrolase [Enterococcus phoeniculicola]|uniref:GDSL-like lipase/acylhydrolase n=1 Tax=Enterococcus phoeniculicola ATCC BAA-412 TaxID=1158610 RepID=R3W3N3_9ENTE|nr:SGNH/GDSL hydrolase family protein [Enterococcus phoeniculicola]EOL42081.1 GDSL-like lipase/acylhydrolase [Enterococcus phoeniculicola ATCC BAA-412]EOT79640.1 GDSL-like lipase/acylhydrolase [Enterococcus phoeniculicola ATCC BAA-412]OJG71705.1 GDSL-like lipase/acylhydrolase [Enterococcus phoeniculicola]
MNTPDFIKQKKRQRFLFIGDSITDVGRDRENFYDLGHGYPFLIASILAKELPDYDIECLNRGIGGNKINDLQERWQEDCLSLKPDVVTMLIGINDTWHHTASDEFGSKKEAQRFESSYRQLLEQLKQSTDATIVLMEPFVLPYPEDRRTWRKDLDQKIQIIRTLAEEYQTIFVPLDGKLNALGIAYGHSHYTGEDGVHPTLAGHAEIAESWLQATHFK